MQPHCNSLLCVVPMKHDFWQGAVVLVHPGKKPDKGSKKQQKATKRYRCPRHTQKTSKNLPGDSLSIEKPVTSPPKCLSPPPKPCQNPPQIDLKSNFASNLSWERFLTNFGPVLDPPRDAQEPPPSPQTLPKSSPNHPKSIGTCLFFRRWSDLFAFCWPTPNWHWFFATFYRYFDKL